MIAPDHPAVEAAMLEMTKEAGPLARTLFRRHALRDAADVLNAALPDLTAATPENLARLRDTPVGRALMAESWQEGADAGEKDYADALTPGHECPRNPYQEADQ